MIGSPSPLISRSRVSFNGPGKHNGSRAKVERHTITDVELRVARKSRIVQPSLFVVVHADHSAGRGPAVDLRVTPSIAVRDYRCGPLNVLDVIYVGLGRVQCMSCSSLSRHGPHKCLKAMASVCLGCVNYGAEPHLEKRPSESNILSRDATRR